MANCPPPDWVDATVHAARDVVSPWRNRDKVATSPGPFAQAETLQLVSRILGPHELPLTRPLHTQLARNVVLPDHTVPAAPKSFFKQPDVVIPPSDAYKSTVTDVPLEKAQATSEGTPTLAYNASHVGPTGSKSQYGAPRVVPPMSSTSLPIGYPLKVPFMLKDFEQVWQASSPAYENKTVTFPDPREGVALPTTSAYPIFQGSTRGCGRQRILANERAVPSLGAVGQPTLGLGPADSKEFNQEVHQLLIGPNSDYLASQEWDAAERRKSSERVLEWVPKPAYSIKRSSQPSRSWKRSWPYRPVVYLNDVPYAYLCLFPGLKGLSENQFFQLRKLIPSWGLENGKTQFKCHKRICRSFLETLKTKELVQAQSINQSTSGLGRGITIGPWPPTIPPAHSHISSEEDTDPFEDAVEDIN